MSQPIRAQGSHFVFFDRSENTNFVEDVEILLPVKFRSKMSQPIRGQGGNLVFPIGLKNTKVVEFCSTVSEEKLKM